jgi:hypothetical protein
LAYKFPSFEQSYLSIFGIGASSDPHEIVRFHPDDIKRSTAIHHLSDFPSNIRLETLYYALSDPNWNIRHTASDFIMGTDHLPFKNLLNQLRIPTLHDGADPRINPTLSVTRDQDLQKIISRKNNRLALLFIFGQREYAHHFDIRSEMYAQTKTWNQSQWDEIEKELEELQKRWPLTNDQPRDSLIFNALGIDRPLTLLQSMRLFMQQFEAAISFEIGRANSNPFTTSPHVKPLLSFFIAAKALHPKVDDEAGRIIYAPFLAPDGKAKNSTYANLLEIPMSPTYQESNKIATTEDELKYSSDGKIRMAALKLIIDQPMSTERLNILFFALSDPIPDIRHAAAMALMESSNLELNDVLIQLSYPILPGGRGRKRGDRSI